MPEEPPDSLRKELRERLKELAKSIEELNNRITSVSKELEKLREQLLGGR